MAAGWLMHGLIMVSTVVLPVGQSPAGRATTLTLYGVAMNLDVALGAALGGLARGRGRGQGNLVTNRQRFFVPLAMLANQEDEGWTSRFFLMHTASQA